MTDTTPPTTPTPAPAARMVFAHISQVLETVGHELDHFTVAPVPDDQIPTALDRLTGLVGVTVHAVANELRHHIDTNPALTVHEFVDALRAYAATLAPATTDMCLTERECIAANCEFVADDLCPTCRALDCLCPAED